MQAGIYRQAGLQLHNQIYFELIAFELCSSKAIFYHSASPTVNQGTSSQPFCRLILTLLLSSVLR